MGREAVYNAVSNFQEGSERNESLVQRALANKQKAIEIDAAEKELDNKANEVIMNNIRKAAVMPKSPIKERFLQQAKEQALKLGKPVDDSIWDYVADPANQGQMLKALDMVFQAKSPEERQAYMRVAAGAVQGDPAEFAAGVGKWAAERDAKQAEIAAKALADAKPTPSKLFEQTQSLRNEYSKLPAVANAAVIKDSFNKIRLSRDELLLTETGSIFAARKNLSKDGAADMSLIYNFVKMMDPNAVKEGEFNNVKSTVPFAGLLNRYMEQLKSGGMLDDEARKNIIAMAEQHYKTQVASVRDINKEYVARAQRFGINPDDVVMRFDVAEDKEFVDKDAKKIAALKAQDDARKKSIAIKTQTDALRKQLPEGMTPEQMQAKIEAAKQKLREQKEAAKK